MNYIKRNKTLCIVGFVSIILALTFAHILKNPLDVLIEKVFNIGYEASASNDFIDEDGLYVITTGTGAPLPEKGRASAQTVVIAGDETLVFDAGTGSTLNFGLAGLGYQHVDAMFLTHYHSDHIGDMGEFLLKRWASGEINAPLDIYGPQGLDEVLTGFESAYTLDMSYRVAHHGKEMANPDTFGGNAIEFDLGRDLNSSEVIYSTEDVQVIAFNVDHAPVYPAVGYRVNYKDRSVVITGDTIYTESLVEHSMDTDLIVSEALHMEYSELLSEISAGDDSSLSTVATDIMDYHISPEEVATLATEANIDQILYTHFLPPIPAEILKVGFVQDAKELYDGGMYLANDGTLVKMPINSDEIIISELLQ